MTDRELLELAAKAASISVRWDEEAQVFFRNDCLGTVPWCPLTDDGDALRLAVKLHLLYGTNADLMLHFCVLEWQDNSGASDPCAATRRAIVRAAAEIGRSMP